MKALAVLALLLGAMALLQRPYDFSRENAWYQAIALNYAIYRNEVFRLAFAQPGISGDIAISALHLPDSWKPLRGWRARIVNGLCYVYGEASPQEISAVRKLFRGSFALGEASAGKLVPSSSYGSIPVPDFIPNGSLVSVTEVNG